MAARLEAPRWALPAAFAALAGLLGALAGFDPMLAIGGTLGLAFLLIAFVNLAAGLVVFTVLAFLEFSLPEGGVVSLPEGGEVSFIKGAGVLLALAWLAHVATKRGEEDTFFSVHPGATYLFLGFLGWGALSITWSETSSGTLVDISRYLLNFGLVVIAFTALRQPKYVMAVFAAWVLGTAVTAAYGLIEKPTAEGAEALRIESTVGNANVLATILIAGMVLSIAIAFVARGSPGLRIAASSAALLALFSFVFTGSRSGVVALAAVMVTSVLVAGSRWRAKAVVGSLVLTLAAVVFFAAFAPPAIRERIAQTVPGQVPTNEGRETLWQVGWRMVEDQPLRGVGLGSFQSSSIHYVSEPGSLDRTDQVIDTAEVAHNIYLQVLAELGVVGELLFLAILGFPIGCALVAARNFARAEDQSMEIMSRALVVALAAILAADFFASEQFNKLLWLLLAMGPVLLAVSRASLAARDPDVERGLPT